MKRRWRLDTVELDHVKRLACVPNASTLRPAEDVDGDVQAALDDFATLPAAVVNGRYDVLAYNRVYALVFPALVAEPRGRRNLIRELFTRPACCNPFHRWKQETIGTVGVLRATYARNVGDPAWTAFIDELVAESPAFAKAWAEHPVCLSRPKVKSFRHADVGVINVRSTPAELSASPGQRLSILVPQDDASRTALARLAAPDFVPSPPHRHDPV